MTERTLFRLTFIPVDDGVVALDGLATDDEFEVLAQAVYAIDARKLRVQDLQCYRPTAGSSSLGSVLGDIVFAAERSEALPEPLDAYAEAIDAWADAHPEEGQSWQLEFVWDNGGGDDNAFTDSFRAPTHGEGMLSVAAFHQAFEAWLEETGNGYDSTVTPEFTPTASVKSVVRQFLEWFDEDTQHASLGQLLALQQSWDLNKTLEEAPTAASGRAKPRM